MPASRLLNELFRHQTIFDELPKEEDRVIARLLFRKPVRFNCFHVVLRFVIDVRRYHFRSPGWLSCPITAALCRCEVGRLTCKTFLEDLKRSPRHAPARGEAEETSTDSKARSAELTRRRGRRWCIPYIAGHVSVPVTGLMRTV